MTTPAALQQARLAIQANDVARLTQLLDAQPELLAFHAPSGATLLTCAVEAFAAADDPDREQVFTRPACAELLLRRGVRVDPALWKNVLTMRSRSMLELLARHQLLPNELRVHAALGDLDAVRARVAGADLAQRSQACLDAAAFARAEVANLLLQHCIELDAELGARISAALAPGAFIVHLCSHDERAVAGDDIWHSYILSQCKLAIDAGDAEAFANLLRREHWLLEDANVALQIELIEHATYSDRQAFIRQLLEAQPALLQRRTPPPSAALEYAFEYGQAKCVPLLAQIWPVPDDLPHAAGSGDLERVKRWFDADGRPALGQAGQHYPLNQPRKLEHLHWSSEQPQHVLDSALAWACLNHRFEVAGFLLAHGADIDTDWGTHEPASILHECAIQANYPAAQFLIDRGIDMSLQDYRWQATAEGWARYGADDEQMAAFLVEAKRKRDARPA